MIWRDETLVAFDFETSGTLPEYALQPWRIPTGDTWATSLSVIRYDPELGKLVKTPWCTLFPTVDTMRDFLETAIREGWTLIGYHVVFDIMVLLGYDLSELVMQCKFLDAMLLWKHLEIEPEYEFQSQRNKKRSYALKPAGHERWLPSRLGRHEEVDFHSTEPASLAKLQAYNDDDSVDTWLIAKMAWRELGVYQQQAAAIEAQCLALIAQGNYEGMMVDTLTTRHNGARLVKDAADMLAALGPHGITEKVVRSPIQLADLMFNPPSHPDKPGWGLPVLKENKSKTVVGKTSRSTDKEVLHELAFQDPRAAQVKSYREALNAESKFSKSILDSADYHGDGRTRPAAIVFGTYSGRMTYSSKQGKGVNARPTGWALHQMSRDKKLRENIIAPPGYTIMEFDAAGQEFRWMAVASRDPTMLALCAPGEDAHSYMGSQIVGSDYRQLVTDFAAGDPGAFQNRYLGKFANLSLQYRTGARKLRVKARVDYNIPMELPEAQRIHRTYQQTYPGVPVYWEQSIAQTKACGFVETFAGRRVTVEGDWNGEFGWSMGSTSLNYKIQGTGADQKYLALAVIKPYLTQIGAYFAWDLHDGIYLYVPNDKVAEAAVKIKYLLDNLPWDCKTGASWGTLKDYHFS